MNITKIRWTIKILAVVGLGISLFVSAQPTDKPLTNADVIAMVQANLPESVVVAAIQSHPAKFDTSPSALIRLQKAHVTQNEMDAIMAASTRGTGAAPSSAPAATSQPAAAPAPSSSPSSRMPKVSVIRNGSAQELPLEKTQLAQTKTKPSSMKNLAADSAVTQAMQAGINTAAMSTAMHMNSGLGGTTVQEAGSIFAGVMSHRKPTVTYVWGVPNPASTNVLQSSSPTFSVDFSRSLGISADDYEPALVKLTPAQNTCRIVGATQGKEDARSSPSADWQIYSHFLEERVTVNAKKLGPGKYELSPGSELLPGEYAVVLRPVSKTKNFSGGDVARAQGDGLMFDALWSFQISDSAE